MIFLERVDPKPNVATKSIARTSRHCGLEAGVIIILKLISR